ncbi:MAG: right-handed parallel beta-helix repeat-containing protein [Fervidicoccaceae archaeon]
MSRFRLFPLPDVGDVFVTVAASDTPDSIKMFADYKCTGKPDVGGDEAVIGEAVSNNVSVLLLPGTFWLSDPVSIPSNRLIQGFGHATVVKAKSGYGDKPLLSLSSATDVVVRGLTLDANSSYTGVSIDRCSRVVLDNVVVKDVVSKGIGVTDSDNVDVRNCDVINSSFRYYFGVYFYGSSRRISNIRVIGCRVIMGGRGINIERCDRAVVSENVVEDQDNAGIFCSSLYSSVISKNVISKTGFGIYEIGGMYNAIVGNSIQGSGYLWSGCSPFTQGMFVYGEKFTVISGNTVFRSKGHGIHIQSCEGVIVSNNVVVASSQTSNNSCDNVYIVASNYCLVSGNIIRKGDEANKPRYGLYVTGSYNVIEGNNLYDSGVSGDISDAGTNTRKRDNVGLTGAWLTDS